MERTAARSYRENPLLVDVVDVAFFFFGLGSSSRLLLCSHLHVQEATERSSVFHFPVLNLVLGLGARVRTATDLLFELLSERGRRLEGRHSAVCSDSRRMFD